MSSLTVFGIEGLPEVRPGDDLATLIAGAASATPGTALADGDVVVVTQKIVSKAEGRLVPCPDEATRVALVEAQSVRVLRRRGPILVTETPQGFVCANAGVDLSNVDDGTAALLPIDADRSARRIRDGLRGKAGVTVGVVVSDTFGRTWRNGQTDVAIGCAGVAALVDLRGTADSFGRVLDVTEIAVADEIAGAAELVMGKARGVPVAVVRGLDPSLFRESSVKAELVRSPTADFFR